MDYSFVKAMEDYPVALKSKIKNSVPPVDIGKIWAEDQKLRTSFTSEDELFSRYNEAFRKYSKEFDNYFREILKKNNISEKDWLAKGKIICMDGMNKCIYENLYIFWYTEPKINTVTEFDGTTYKAELTSYCGEPVGEDKYLGVHNAN